MLADDGAPHVGTVRRVPHYAMRTVTNSAPEFANHEQDVIRQSFSSGNHTWMKEALPVELGPDSVNLLRRQRMERNRLSEPVPQTWSKMTQLWGGGYYQEFEYMPDEYDRRPNEAFSRSYDPEKRGKIANHDWRCASQERRMKYESMINDPRNKDTYPYLGGDKDAEEEASKGWLRSSSGGRSGSWSQDRAQESSFLAGKGKGLDDDSRSSRMILPIIVQRLQKRVDQDWEGTTVVVSATDQDLVQIAYHLETVDSERGVLAYMGVLSKDVELLGHLGLRKVSQLWGMRRDFSAEMGVSNEGGETSMDESREHTWIFFLLMPKWVRMRPTDAYYTVHPRSQGSAFRMSNAGSSVLLSLGSSVFDPAEPSRRAGSSQSRDGAATARAPRGGGVRLSGSQPISARGAPPPVDLALIEKAVHSLPAIKESARGLP